jgi:hypothetical protein
MRAGIVARLDLIGDLGEAAAHRHVIGADPTWKEQVDDTGGLAERQPCTKLGLDTDEFGRGAPFQKLRHTSGSPARSRTIGLGSTARARTQPRLPDSHRAEQGLDDPLPAIVKWTRQTTMTASAIDGGALLDLALDHPKLKLLQQIFRLRESKTKVVRNGC